LKSLLVFVCLCLPLAATAARVSTEGFSIDVPEGWATQQGVMGVPLMARPNKARDAEGWGQDLLTVTSEPADRRRTCLDAFTQRKLTQLAYHASEFVKLEEEALDLPARLKGKGTAVATRLTLRYREGPRELMAYVLVLDAGPRFLTATLTSTPARFEFQRARFRAAVESLRLTAAEPR